MDIIFVPEQIKTILKQKLKKDTYVSDLESEAIKKFLQHNWIVVDEKTTQPSPPKSPLHQPPISPIKRSLPTPPGFPNLNSDLNSVFSNSSNLFGFPYVQPSVEKKVSFSQSECDDGAECKDWDCKLVHPISRKRCDIGAECKRWDCKFVHPISRPKKCLCAEKNCPNIHNLKNLKNLNKKTPCFHLKDCVVWKCQFEHSPERKTECDCEDNKCQRLHRHQALCKNKNHPEDCKMAHSKEELDERLKYFKNSQD